MKKIIVANWKMYLTLSQSKALAKRITKLQITNYKMQVVLCPSFVAMEEVWKAVRGTRIKLGAQDVEPEKRGAYTGAVGLDDLGEIGVQYVLVGHSERRRLFHETDALVNKKLRAVLDAGMRPILCVGEPEEVRRYAGTQRDGMEKVRRYAGKQGDGMEKVRRYVGMQVRRGLKNISREDLKRVTVAYEPVWAIGSGQPDTPEDASAMHGWIRKVVDEYPHPTLSQRERGWEKMMVLYGGSVNGKNAAAFLSAPGIDGLLVGRASTNARELLSIVRSAE